VQLSQETEKEFKEFVKNEIAIKRSDPHYRYIESTLSNLTKGVNIESDPFYVEGLRQGVRYFFNQNHGENVPEVVGLIRRFMYQNSINHSYFDALLELAVEAHVEFFTNAISIQTL